MSFRRSVLTDEFEESRPFAGSHCPSVKLGFSAPAYIQWAIYNSWFGSKGVNPPESGTRKSSKKSHTTSHLLQLSQESAYILKVFGQSELKEELSASSGGAHEVPGRHLSFPSVGKQSLGQ